MSSYPDAFRINCVGKLPTDNNYSICKQKPIILENKNVVEEGNQKPVKCQPYNPPTSVIQSNLVPKNAVSNKSWSNSRGYGNIVVATHDTENNMHGRVHPYNRLRPLTKPYQTNVEVNDAWAINKTN